MKVLTKKIELILSLWLLFAIILISDACAETVILRSGAVISGKIVDQDGQRIILDLMGVKLTYDRADIKEILNEKNGLKERTTSSKKISDEVQTYPIVEAEREEVKSIAEKIYIMDYDLEFFLDNYYQMLNDVIQNGDQNEVKETIEQGIQYIEKILLQAREIEATREEQELKELFLTYLEDVSDHLNLIKVNTVLGETPHGKEQMDDAVNELSKSAQRFQEELQRYSEQFSLYVPKSDPSMEELKKEIRMELQGYQTTFQRLASQMESLQRENIKLKNQTDELIQRNKKMQEFLMKYIESQNLQQKQDFLQYLQGY